MNYLLIIVLLSLSLFGCSQKPSSNTVKVETLIQATSSWDGQELPSYHQGKPQITILKITIPAQTRLPLHTHPVINAGVLLKGELTVFTKTNKTIDLKAGDPLIEVVNTWHYGSNQSNEEAVIIVFYAGVLGQPITERSPQG